MLTLRTLLRFLSIPACATSILLIFLWSDFAREEPRASAAAEHFDVGQVLRSERPELIGSDTGTLLQDAKSLALRAPLNAYPYALHGMAEYHRGGVIRSERLMRQALRLDPRSATVRSWLLFHYLKQGRVAEAVDQGAVLFQLDEGGHIKREITALFVALLNIPESRVYVMKRLGDSPVISDVIQGALAGGMDPRLAFQLATGPHSKEPAKSSETRTLIMHAFLDAGDYEGAYKIWKSTLTSRDKKINFGGFVYDPNFTIERPPAPFAWTLRNDQEVQAEVIPSGLNRPSTALRVMHFEGRDVVAAHQLVLLPAGSFRLVFLARRVGPRSPLVNEHTYRLKIACKNSGALLLSVPIDPKSEHDWIIYASNFDLSGACPAQFIEIISSNESRATNPVLITGISITPN